MLGYAETEAMVPHHAGTEAMVSHHAGQPWCLRTVAGWAGDKEGVQGEWAG